MQDVVVPLLCTESSDSVTVAVSYVPDLFSHYACGGLVDMDMGFTGHVTRPCCYHYLKWWVLSASDRGSWAPSPSVTDPWHVNVIGLRLSRLFTLVFYYAAMSTGHSPLDAFASSLLFLKLPPPWPVTTLGNTSTFCGCTCMAAGLCRIDIC